MSNHVWMCAHGVEFGQGCRNVCALCETRYKELEAARTGEENRRFLVKIAFADWVRTGAEVDWRSGVRYLAKMYNVKLDVMEDNDPARPACAVCN